MCRSTLRRLAAALLSATLGFTFVIVPLTLSGCESAPEDEFVGGSSEADRDVQEDLEAYDDAADEAAGY